MIKGYVGASPVEKQALVLSFATLYRAVVPGMWQTLEPIHLTVWLLGTASAARRDGPRSVFVILVVLGVLVAAIALYRVAAAG